MKCVNHATVDAAYQCIRCRAPICVDCEQKLNGQSICDSCMGIRQERLAARLAAETRRVNYPGAVISGLAVTILFPLLWSQLAVSKGYGLSIGATLLGGIVGYSVVAGAGAKRGRPLQQMSAIMAVIGILLAHFLILLRTGKYTQLGMPDSGSSLLAAGYAFPSYLSSLQPWDGLFLFLGIAWAYWMPHVRTLRE